MEKRFDQIVGRLVLWTGLQKHIQLPLFFLLQIGSPTKKEPGGMSRQKALAMPSEVRLSYGVVEGDGVEPAVRVSPSWRMRRTEPPLMI